MTAECLSCSKGTTVEEFCKTSDGKGVSGCKPKDPPYVLTDDEKKELMAFNDKVAKGESIPREDIARYSELGGKLTTDQLAEMKTLKEKDFT